MDLSVISFANIFSQVCGLSFLSWLCPSNYNASNFDEFQFSSITCGLMSLSKKPLPNPRMQKFILTFSFESFIALIPVIFAIWFLCLKSFYIPLFLHHIKEIISRVFFLIPLFNMCLSYFLMISLEITSIHFYSFIFTDKFTLLAPFIYFLLKLLSSIISF